MYFPSNFNQACIAFSILLTKKKDGTMRIFVTPTSALDITYMFVSFGYNYFSRGRGDL